MSELIKKLSKIAASAGNIKKNGKYEYKQTKYDYLKVDDIYDHFNGPMSANGVTFGTRVKEWMIQDNLIVGVIEGVFSDGESEHTCEVGSAARAGDKMMRNLMQNAVKQIFLQVFCISSGDPDPDGAKNTPLEKKPVEPQEKIIWATLTQERFMKGVEAIKKGFEKVNENADGVGIKYQGKYIWLTIGQYEQLKK